MIAVRSTSGALLVLCASLFLPGCQAARTTGKVVLTPLTVVRDVVDAPLVSLANVFDTWAGRSSRVPRATGGVSIGSGGVRPFLGFDLSYYIFTPLAWLFGGLDYLVCRSLWPDWPTGISPFREPGQGWGSLYFPNTRALWGGEEALDGGGDGDRDGDDGGWEGDDDGGADAADTDAADTSATDTSAEDTRAADTRATRASAADTSADHGGSGVGEAAIARTSPTSARASSIRLEAA